MDPTSKYDPLKILGDILITDQILGKGCQSEVRLGRHAKNTQEFYAVKIIKRPEGVFGFQIDELTKREIDILKTMDHENIVKLIKFMVSPSNIYMVFEYCNGNTLMKYMIDKNGHLPLEDCLGILVQICSAFELLSRHNIMHRDMKPENVMFHNGILKIVDFGFARVLEDTEPGSYTRCGTPNFMCPQILKGQKFSGLCDVWSVGVMLFQVFTGEHPFIGPEMSVEEINNLNPYKLIEIIMTKKVKWELLSNCPIKGIKELLMAMLQKEEQNRCSWKEVIEAKNEFLRQFGINKITTFYLKSSAVFPGDNEKQKGRMSIEEEKLIDLEKSSLENQWVNLLAFLNYQKKFASSFQKIASLFYNTGKNKTVQVDQTMGITLFYLLCQVPYLKLKGLLHMLSDPSLLQAYLIENGIFGIILEDLIHTPSFEKIKMEVLEELQGLQDIAKELEVKVMKELLRKTTTCKVTFYSDFLKDIENGKFLDFNFTYTQLRITAKQFLDHYKKELARANFEFLITFRLLQVVVDWNKTFYWDAAGKKETKDFDHYLEGIKGMQKNELTKIIQNPEQAYLSFDFFGNAQFLEYFGNLFPTPNKDQLERIKRRWFKRNIDPTFDVDFIPAADTSQNTGNAGASAEQKAAQPQNPPNEAERNQSSARENAKEGDSSQESRNTGNQATNEGEKPVALPFFQNVLFTVEAYMKFSFLISYLGFKILANYLGITISILAILRQGKIPRPTKEYARKVLLSEHFHNLFYFALFSFFPDFLNILYFLPMMLHCWIGLCNFAFIKKGRIYSGFKKHVDITRSKEKTFLVFKQKIEISILLWLIFKLVFTTHFSATLLLLYGCFIRAKYYLNENMQRAFWDIDSWIMGYMERCPGFIKKTYEWFRKFCRSSIKLKE